ncbi:MAG: V-type ATP synthase subunit A [Nitrospirae bacterium]|nr:V-type ATP synthase subunit A [Nitrospirota bacterium]MBI3350986.1 V-type ATP synthase subunit A [Nitrospirota bacterium]
MKTKGKIVKVSGPTIVASGMKSAGIYHRVTVGTLKLLGEVIRLERDRATIQVYEDTIGLSLGEEVEDLGEPLMAELGPGLISSIFDGVQRPLTALLEKQGDFISRGFAVPALSRSMKWRFVPSVKPGAGVYGGDLLGTVQETDRIIHRIMVPPGRSGKIKEIRAGEFTVQETIAVLDGGIEISLMQRWPVRSPRPFKKKLLPNLPFITGQRIFDMVFPIALGGTAIMPGGFGTGKTVAEQSLAKYARAEIIVYIGCGERGNEMTDVLSEFPNLQDPQTGRPLMERTILIINTSNMPVAAREASIFTGITAAEYYRDMGYHVALMADSTSRWAEALREISSRLEEMPGEEGYPTYLSTRLSHYYERGGRVACLGREERVGSVTIVSAISPPGGDFSEPVSQSSMRIAGGIWSLDSDLAHRRHFPAINWKRSYSLYTDLLDPWFRQQVASDWSELRAWLMEVLQQEEELLEVAQLVGKDALQEGQRAILEISRLIREDYLRQSSFSQSDANCPLEKQYWMLKVLHRFYQLLMASVQKGTAIDVVLDQPFVLELIRMKEWPSEGFEPRAISLINLMDEGITQEPVHG